jgi:hypothetical protein
MVEADGGGWEEGCKGRKKFGKGLGGGSGSGPQLDLNAPGGYPGEVALLQGPVGGCRDRLSVLLEEWPEHPILCQLAEIADRIIGLPLFSPIKQALTGLELLLARAQVCVCVCVCVRARVRACCASCGMPRGRRYSVVCVVCCLRACVLCMCV